MTSHDFRLWIKKIFVQSLPRKSLSRLLGWLATSSVPPAFAHRWMIQWFARTYQVNLSEAELPLQSYKTLGAFFTRNLRPGVRPLGTSLWVHPTDSVLTVSGVISDSFAIQAKNITYSLDEFFGGSSATQLVQGQTLLTYYLSPKDYHHVHSPCAGWVRSATLIRGDLLPVNPWSLRCFSNVFSQNERIVLEIEEATTHKRVLFVMVGATVVGQMTLTFDSSVRSNLAQATPRLVRDYSAAPIEITQGQRLGTFHLGSTVIMTVPASIQSETDQMTVKYGEQLI